MKCQVICDACETVAWCSKNGCIPIQPAPRLSPSPISHMAATLERCAKQERARLQPEQVVQLRQEQKAGRSLSQLAKAFRLSKAGVWSICSFRTRKDVVS